MCLALDQSVSPQHIFVGSECCICENGNPIVIFKTIKYVNEKLTF